MYSVNIIGLGITNQAILKYLESKEIPYKIFLEECSSIKDPLLSKSILPVSMLKEYKHKSIISPGIPPNKPYLKGVEIISDYDFLQEELKNADFSIWISGTNGKTTTTQMLGAICKEAVVAGNIGTPLASVIKQLDKKILILETSSFTLEYTKLSTPSIYILLPLHEDHISWHGDFKSYVDSKLSVVLRMNSRNFCLIPFELKSILNQKLKHKNDIANIFYYKDANDLINYFKIDKSLLASFKEPNILNASLAISSLIYAGYEDKASFKNLLDFKIGSHRMEEFIFNDILFVNDSKGTNPHASNACLNTYKDKKIFLLLGGDTKGANFSILEHAFRNLDIEIFTLGVDEDKIISFLKSIDKNALKCSNLESALKAIKARIDLLDVKTNLAVILTPASSSLDQFSSYAKRGEEFIRLAKQIFS